MFNRFTKIFSSKIDSYDFHAVPVNDLVTLPIRSVRVMPSSQVLMKKKVFLQFPAGHTKVDAEFVYELYDIVALKISTFNGKHRNTVVSIMPQISFTLFFQGKLLSKQNCRLIDYNIVDNSSIQISFHALHGGNLEFMGKKNTFHVFDNRGNKVLKSSFNRQNSKRQARKVKHYKNLTKNMRSNHFLQSESECDGFFGDITKISTLFNSVKNDFVVKMIEDVALLMMYMLRAKNMTDVTLAITMFVKLRVNASLVGVMSQKMIKHFTDNSEIEMQSIDQLRQLRKMVDQYDQVWDTPIVKRLYKFMMFSMSFSLFENAGLSFENFKYDAFEKEAIKRKYHKRGDFVHCIIDTALFLAERGYQSYSTGSLEPLFHSETTYQEWYDECADLKRKSNFLGNCEAHGIEYHSYLQKLDEAIEKGDSIIKYSTKVVGNELRFLKQAHNDLQMIKAEELSKKSAAQERKAPFAILVEGGSSVGKSTFSKMMFKFYGKVMNLPIDDEYIYTRNAADPFWSGWTTAKWGLRLDDIAFMKASLGVMDPTLMELICVVNNVPYCPNQAELKDKGKTPVKAKFVIATTNTINLNAHAYFSCPLAVQRRLPIIVSLKPKSEYQKPGMPEFINPDSLPMIDESWPDFWDIECKQVKPAVGSSGCQMAEIVPIEGAKFSDIKTFLKWFGDQSTRFEKIQKKAMTCDVKMSSFDVCRNCFSLSSECDCGDLNCSSQELQFVPNMQSSDVTWKNWLTTIFTRQSLPDMENLRPVGEIIHSNGQDYIRRMVDGKIVVSPVRCVSPGINLSSEQISDLQPSYLYRNYADIVDSMISQPETVPHFWNDVFTVFIEFGMRLYFDYTFVQTGVRYAATLPLVRRLFWRFMYGYANKTRVVRVLIGFLGANVQNKLSKVKNWHIIVSALTAASAIWVGVKLIKSMSNKNDFTGDMQGMHFSQLPKTEKENVWKNDSFQTTTFDINPMMVNYQSLGFDTVCKTLLRNVVNIKVQHSESVGRPGRALCVGGHLFVSNNHIFEETSDNLIVHMSEQSSCEGVSRNCTFKIDQDSLFRMPDKDLVFFEVKAIAPKKDITGLIMKSSFRGQSKGRLLGRKRSGESEIREVYKVQHTRMYAQQTKRSYDHWQMDVIENTEQGDCGSVLLMETGAGYMIGGLHQLGGLYNRAYSVFLDSDTVDAAIKHFGRYLVQSCPPEIDVEHHRQPMSTELNNKSAVRWMQEGTAAVYGSFTGFRPRMISKVCTSLLGDNIKLLRDWEIPFGKPVMNCWKPWHLALKDVFAAKHNYNRATLKSAVEGYTNDILNGLEKTDLDELCVLDDSAAVNGLAGVQYIDKMNLSSSMGFPWKHTKKDHLIPGNRTDEQPDAVMFTEEIMERVNRIRDRYKAGCRWMPVFTGHLKDEPKEQAKIDLSKTRVFTGGPVDWSLVVRQYLLSFVRVVQLNKFTFEAGPGTVAQSLEWEKIREYLIQHGESRMVAGDYGKFDKKMLPDFVLAAFDVIINVHRAAGWGDEELKVLQCIAEDVAYPLTDFNGDLIEFFGTNPSGQPLTVIVNSIVNSLYVRYCYLELNPKKEVHTFKKNVALMTYGDDNVFGVSKNIDWFHHTSVQTVLSSIGVEYTMADKHTASVPFIHIDNISFLKRSWRWDHDVEAFLCPLEEGSIRKMLTIWIPSKTISADLQMASVIESALNEWFFYGKQKFEEERKFLVDLATENDLLNSCRASTFPSWEELYERFWKNSLDVKIQRNHTVKTMSMLALLQAKKSQTVSYSAEIVWEHDF